MSRQHHELKLETEYYQAWERGDKNFELRFDDRDYQIYDMVILKEAVGERETGRKLSPKEIIYILESNGGNGLKDGWVILGFM